jgi:hypothetical protein
VVHVLALQANANFIHFKGLKTNGAIIVQIAKLLGRHWGKSHLPLGRSILLLRLAVGLARWIEEVLDNPAAEASEEEY